MDNKGDISLKGAVELVLVIGILAVVVMWPGKLYAAVFGNDDEDSAKRNFENLITAVEQMQQESYTNRWLAYFIMEDWTLAGFSHDQQYIFKQDEGSNVIARPTECTGACLCLYSERIERHSVDERDEDIVKCVSYPGNFYIFGDLSEQGIFDSARNEWRGQDWTSFSYPEPVPDSIKISPEYFLMYGKAMPTSQLYLEYYETNGNAYLFMTPDTGNQNEREKYFRICADAAYTSAECRGEQIDTVVPVQENGNQVMKVCKLREQEIMECFSRGINPCPEGRISSECACGSKAYAAGNCIGGEWVRDGCVTSSGSKVTQCGDYCMLDQITACDLEELDICNKDPCRVGICEGVSIQGFQGITRNICRSN